MKQKSALQFMTEWAHEKSGLTGKPLQDLVCQLAMGMAEKAGNEEAFKHFKAKLNA